MFSEPELDPSCEQNLNNGDLNTKLILTADEVTKHFHCCGFNIQEYYNILYY